MEVLVVDDNESTALAVIHTIPVLIDGVIATGSAARANVYRATTQAHPAQTHIQTSSLRMV